MSRYKDRLQIIADLLSIVRTGARKTKIMYQANLSYKLLGRYLDEVLSAGLVSFQNGDQYVLTAKGKEFLISPRRILKALQDSGRTFKPCKQWEDVTKKMCYNANRVSISLNRRV